MRRLLYISILSVAAVSCKGYLDVQPQGEVIPKTDEEFAAIMDNRIFDIEGGGDEYVIGNMDAIAKYEGYADNLDANIMVGNLVAYSGDNINIRQSEWRSIFQIIRDCNIVIENLEGRTSDVAKGTLAAAYAMKGICYYNLLRNWCEPWDAGKERTQTGLPIVDRFDIKSMPDRASLYESAEYTETMLLKALAQENKDAKYFFTEFVIKAYLARLYFWCEDWDAVISTCNDIITNSGLVITPAAEYEEMIQAENDRKGEVIVRSHINNASELDWYFSYVRGYISSRPASSALIRLFGDDPEKDVRYRISFDSRRFNTKTPECRVRLSEIVLMLAEAYCHKKESGNALAWLNELRRNRIDGVTDFTESTLPPVRTDNRIKEDATGKPLTPLLQAILDERQKELYMEGDRWFELKRNGRPEWWIINNGLKYTTKKYMYTAPVYKGDVDLNHNFEQNPGYDS